MNVIAPMSRPIIERSALPSFRFQGLWTDVLFAAEGKALVEHTLDPHTLGAPEHTHLHEDEVAFVTSGHLGVKVGDETRVLGPNDTVFKPRGVPHAFWNPADVPVRWLEVITPGDLAQYFADIASVLSASRFPDAEVYDAVATRYGIGVEHSSIAELTVEHDLKRLSFPHAA